MKHPKLRIGKVLLQGHIVLVLVALLNACAVMERALPVQAQVNPGYSYVYGDFRLEKGYNVNTIIAIVMDDPKGLPAYLGFYGDNMPTTYAVKLEPGTYTFGQVAFITSMTEHFRKPLSADLGAISLKLEPNKAYYLGDYVGEVSVTFTYPTTNYYWKLNRFDDRFDATTERFLSRYPHFASIETVNIAGTFSEKVVSALRGAVDELDALVKEGNYEQAYIKARRMAESGNIPAIMTLGYLYEKGLFVEKSLYEAKRWYRQVAEKNIPFGMMALGRVLLVIGYGEAEDGDGELDLDVVDEGVSWITQAGLRSNPEALHFLCRAADGESSSVLARIRSAAWCHVASDVLPPVYASSRDEALDAYNRITASLNAEAREAVSKREAKIRSKMQDIQK